MAAPVKSSRELRARIGETVRDLRVERHLSQADLARRLGISQATLSLVERGRRSLTAEQLLAILGLFNVGASRFAGRAVDAERPLQNVLARFGAEHLQESEGTIAPESLEEVHEAIRTALVSGAPRLVTALGPVIVNNIDQLGFPRLRARLADIGFERRLDWLLDNVLEALHFVLEKDPTAKSFRQRRRAATVLELICDYRRPPSDADAAPDVLDRSIRSKKTAAAVQLASSPISKRWGVVTALQVEDFVRALQGDR
ncbi:MAG: helix-turn-helix transcriptional regulator [Deltaproteobacteria bacterium]|nr:helix-turn-helix transcriptional regulator [Deltaproteobacteria bacterium]